MTTKQKLNANAAYENSHLVAQDLLDRISELMQDCEAPDEQVIDWSHVGSMNEINSRLSAIVAFMTGTEK